VCDGACGVEVLSEPIHWDAQFPLPLQPEDVLEDIDRGPGKRNDVLWYQPSTDTFMLFDLNFPDGGRVLAFRRGGEVTPWSRVVDIRPRVFWFAANNPANGKAYVCLLDLDRLVASAEARGVLFGWVPLKLFTTFGQIPTLSPELWSDAVTTPAAPATSSPIPQ
jgi:hypothetical protein